ncbi:hypothetical protein [Candidatus Mesenet endosymbiont of Phosphuga atrata]|uniref:hypothetical protein n=1 Tax=Candidatus Mesenet endosymbiont of Phosphuga atrata TaxID=3066221 RepID=UPI0030D20787
MLSTECQSIDELPNNELNNQLRKAINDNDYNKVRELISHEKLKPIDNQVYKLIFSESVLRDLCLKSDLHDIIDFFMKYVPSNFLYNNYFGSHRIVHNIKKSLREDFISLALLGVLPYLLEAVSNSERYDISIEFINVIHLELALKKESGPDRVHLEEAIEAIKKYCTRLKNDCNSSLDIEPYYLLPIKDSPGFKEFKQHFKDIYSAINSNDLNRVKSSLEQIKTSVSEHKVDISSVVQALCCLAKEARFNQDIGDAICHLAGSITYPTCLEKSVSVSSGIDEGKAFKL